MKLRNKKTGEIYSAWSIRIGEEEITSVEQFNNTFEDYKPAEPLIIDEAAAELVRAWAKHWGIEEIRAAIGAGTVELDGWSKSSRRWQEIEILGESMSIDVKENKAYSIDELCGEEAPEPLEPSFIDLDERIKGKDGDTATGKLEYGTDSHYPKAYKIIRDDGEYDTVFYKSNIKTASEDKK